MRDRPAAPSTPPPAAPAADVAFDLWLARGLHEMFGSIASEEIPPGLLMLIERDRERPRIVIVENIDGPAVAVDTEQKAVTQPGSAG